MDVLTSKQAAERLAICPVTVAWLCRTGRMLAAKHGRDWLITRTEVDRYARERRPAHRPRKKR